MSNEQRLRGAMSNERKISTQHSAYRPEGTHTQHSSTMTNLKCTYCGAEYDADTLQTLCPKDGRVLAPQYDLARAARTMTREALRDRPTSMWRYTEIMPTRDPAHVVT